MNKVYVIGVGYRPFDARAKELILKAEVILASKRLFDVFQRYDEFEDVKGRMKVINKIGETISFLHSSLIADHSSRPLILLASGDPLFFGIGRRVVEEFGPDRVELLPDLSSIQLAFGRIKEPWDDAFLMSLHGGPDPEKRRRLPYELKDIPALLEKHHKIAILTDRENNPAVIASSLHSSPITHHSSLSLYICERLGYEDEKITEGAPSEIADMTFGNPNVVIIMRNTPESMPLTHPSPEGEGKENFSAVRFGLSEDEISHSRGLITKDEVRAISIHKLRLPDKGVLWDIGAGSGSVSIEAARLCPGLRVYSIEKNDEQLGNIKDNIVRFGISNVEVVAGEAPDAVGDLRDPDRVFIGGSGGRLSEIFDIAMTRMKRGIIVLNAIAIETLNDAVRLFEQHGLDPEVAQVSVARSKVVSGQRHMNALNPIYVIKGEKR